MKYESAHQTAIRPGLPAHTIRERDTMQQVRIPMDQVKNYLAERIAF